jgi:hypothetical protein
MFGQETHKFLLNSFYISIVLITLSACSILESDTDASIQPALPSKPSISAINNSGTSVAVEQFQPKVKATDVMIELTIDPYLAKNIVIKYGSNPNKLELEKLFSLSELQTKSESDKTIVKVTIKDAGTINPLYVSSAIESEDGVRSEFSAATLVSGAVD